MKTMDQRVWSVFLAPGTPADALEGFDSELLRHGSSSPNYERIQSRMTEASVREKVSGLMRPRSAKKLPKNGVVAAVADFVSGKNSEILSRLGLNLSQKGALEAVAFELLENGYPSLAAKTAKAAFESRSDSFFRSRFCEVYLAVLDRTDFESVSEYLIREIAEGLKILRESLRIFADPADPADHLYLGRLFESCVSDFSQGDLKFAAQSYGKALSLGNTDAIAYMAEMLFRSKMEDEGIEFLEGMWEKYRLPETIRDLGNRYILRGEYAKGLRCSRIVSLLAGESQMVTTAPSEKTISFPSGMFVCRSFLLARERAGGMGAYLRKPVMTAAHDWLSSEVEKISDPACLSQNELDDAFENRLALLQFGAIELSSAEYAVSYLKELDFHMSREGGKEFLMGYFEENWSPYARAYVYRIEEESLAELVSEDRPKFGDSTPEISDSVSVPDDVFADFWDAIATHLAYLSYRFQAIGDEDVMEKLKETAALVTPADDRTSNADIASAVESNAEDFRERGRIFDALSPDLRDWYADLRSRIVESRGESFFRWLFSCVYFPNGGSLALGGNELMFHIVETYFSGLEIAEETLERMMEDLIRSGISDEDVALLSEFLFESGEFSAALDFAFSAKDVSNPNVLRHLLRSAVNVPDLAESIDADFQSWLSESGSEPKFLTDFAYEAMEASPESAVIRGNLAMAYHAFARDSEILRKAVLPAYDRAFSLWDVESGTYAARIAAYELSDLPEARRRMLAVCDRGDSRILQELCDVAWKMGDKEAFATYLSMAEKHELPKVEELRLRDRFAGDFASKIKVLELLPGYFAPPKRGVSEEFLRECREFALSVFSRLETEVPVDFDALRSGLVAARLLALFPESPEEGVKLLVKDRFPMAAYYFLMAERLLSSPVESKKFLEYLHGLSDLRLTALQIAGVADFGEEEWEPIYAMAEIQHFSESFSGTSGHADILLRWSSLLRKIPGGDEFANEIADRLVPPSASAVKWH